MEAYKLQSTTRVERVKSDVFPCNKERQAVLYANPVEREAISLNRELARMLTSPLEEVRNMARLEIAKIGL